MWTKDVERDAEDEETDASEVGELIYPVAEDLRVDCEEQATASPHNVDKADGSFLDIYVVHLVGVSKDLGVKVGEDKVERHVHEGHIDDQSFDEAQREK